MPDSAISFICDTLRVLVIGGICKLFFWDLYLKEYWDSFVQNTKEVAEVCRKADK